MGLIDESIRASLLEEYAIVDTPAEREFDDVVEFAAELCETPTGLVSLVTGERQWFKARFGLEVSETPRSSSFCAIAMLDHEIMVIPDATRDPRFAGNPLVTGEPRIRFYAGAPLISPEGVPLGSLCVIDYVPRDGLTPLQAKGLQVLAEQIVRLLEARRALRRQEEYDALLSESVEQFRILADTMPQMVWSTLPDGYHDYYNARWYEFTGVPEGSTDGEAWNGLFHPDDQARAWARWRHSLETGEPYEIEYRLRHNSGEYRWTLGRALPMRDAADRVVRWFGTCTDIDDQKRMAEERELIASELSHRIKNIFAVIAALIHMSARASPEVRPFADELSERIMALGRAHDFVRPHGSDSRATGEQSNLHGLLGRIFAPYSAAGENRLVITGHDPGIDDRAATPLALIFHELATNSAKYGALSVEGGSVRIAIALDAQFCRMTWSERGGPPADRPRGEAGFGSRLIDTTIARQLRGEIAFDWGNEGLDVRIAIPAEALQHQQ